MIAQAVSSISLILLATSTLASEPLRNSPGWPSVQTKPVTQKLSIDIRIPPAAEVKPGPIEIVKGYVLFRARLSGRDALIMLDNRAVPSIVDTGFAQRNGLRVEALEGTIRTVHGIVPKRLARNITLSVPGVIDVQTGGMAAVDLDPISRAVGRKIDGMFGGELLAQLALVVRSSQGTFQLARSGAVNLPPMVPRVPLLDGRPKVALKVGEETVTVTLDLGDNGMLALTPEAWKRVAGDGAKLSTAGSLGADGQPYNVDKGVLPFVTLGRFTRRNVNVRVIPDSGSGDGDGRLGIGFLADCDFALDIKAGGLWVIPRLRSAPRAPERSTD